MKRLGLVVMLAGCIRAPEIVLVDRATALEQQAGGSFDALEKKLARAGMAPRPVPLTPEQLQTLGVLPQPLGDSGAVSDNDRVDELLKLHCIGEGKEGLLVTTRDACHGTVDRTEVDALVQRINDTRAQLWRWLAARRPTVKPAELRRSWWRSHQEGVVCGGWVQREDGGWEAKGC